MDTNDVIKPSETDVTLQADYDTISTFNDLKTACQTNGVKLIKLGADITCTSDIPIKHSIKILGNDKILDLNEHSIILDEDVMFNAEKLTFHNGDTAIVQAKNTTLELTGCVFTNCVSTNHNNLGSCIYCDIDIESLEVENDFITLLTECGFSNNHSAIFHGGGLTIKNCTFHNNDLTYADENNPGFIYPTDGTLNITGSIFDIDYTANTLCSGEKNMGFAQCILMAGENAIINNSTHEQLSTNDALSFFGEGYNNRSHVFAKYYYPQVSTCVYTSPVINREDKSMCWCVSGIDYVFWTNVQITRASWNTQNETRKITWS